MRISGQRLSGAFVVFLAVLLGCVRPAVADSYTVFNLGGDNGRHIYGIDTAGDVVVWSTVGCGGSAEYCYLTYTDGVATNNGSVAPLLAYDNGSSCSSSPEGFNTLTMVCNDGWIGLGSIYNPNGDQNGVYVGDASDPQFIHSGSAVNQLFLNSAGDFVCTDGQSEELYVAIAQPVQLFQAESAILMDPAPAPEPTSLLLVFSGLLFFAAALRRKAGRHASSYVD
jgi:hypothetical protein